MKFREWLCLKEDCRFKVLYMPQKPGNGIARERGTQIQRVPRRETNDGKITIWMDGGQKKGPKRWVFQ